MSNYEAPAVLEFSQYYRLFLQHMEDSRIFQRQTELAIGQVQNAIATLSQQVQNDRDLREKVTKNGNDIAALKAQAAMWAGIITLICTLLSIGISLFKK